MRRKRQNEKVAKVKTPVPLVISFLILGAIALGVSFVSFFARQGGVLPWISLGAGICFISVVVFMSEIDNKT